MVSSKVILKLNAKKINDRRGGPNFINRNRKDRLMSRNFSSGNSDEEISGNNKTTVYGGDVKVMSPELARFMSNMQEVTTGH